MVKPPKTMQPEGVDLDKINKKPGSIRGFGGDSFRNYMARKIDLQRQQFGVILPPLPPTSPPPNQQQQQQRPRVRFSNEVDQLEEERKRQTTPLLERLVRKHGKVRKRRRNEISSSNSALVSSTASAATRDDNALPNTCDEGRETTKKKGISSRLTSILKKRSPEPSHHGSPSNHRADLFLRGVVVLVNGYTYPDNETLMRMLHRHGGDLEKYETTRITHIIAQNLSFAKAKIYKKQRRPVPVVHPKWIVESVEARKLLPYADYLIEEVKEKTTSVQSFFGRASMAKQKTSSPRAVRKSEASSSRRSVQTPRDNRARDRSLQKRSDIDVTRSDDCGDDQGTMEDVVVAVDDGESSGDEKSAVVSGEAVNGANQAIPKLSQALGEGPLPETRRPAPGNAVEAIVVDHTDSEEMLGRRGSQDPSRMYSFDGADYRDKNSTRPDEKETDTVSNESNDTHRDAVRPEKASTHDESAAIDTQKETSLDTKERPPSSSKRFDAKFINGKLRTTGTDPDFLTSFFSNSRLSFIGSYRQRARQSPTKKLHKRPRVATETLVFHVDMDCFFASVVLRNFPQYRNKPVAISHHGKSGPNDAGPVFVSKQSSSECATCNYEARKFGIKKGMYLGRAKELCPQLVVLKYDFEGYEEVSEQVADILYRQAEAFDGKVEEVSCDEAYMELHLPTDAEDGPTGLASQVAQAVRKEIFEATQCTASIGVGPNKLLAKLATDKVKPDNYHVATSYKELLKPLKLRDLHGIGYRTEPKLATEGLVNIRDVWEMGNRAEGELCRILGPGLGKKIFGFCHGKDDRPVEPAPRKTIGAECNYGVRFGDGPYGIDHMMDGLAKEVCRRMTGEEVFGTRVTLKVKQRKPNAKPPPKFLGHGSCFNLSRSTDTSDGAPTRDSEVIAALGMMLFRELGVDDGEVRGMGIIMSKLSAGTASMSKKAPASRLLTSWFEVAKSKTNEGDVAEQDGAQIMSEIPGGAGRCDGSEVVQDNVTTIPNNEESTSSDSVRELEDDNSTSISPVMAAGVSSAPSSPHDLFVPSLSQIHMSQVEALPSPMKRQIKSKLNLETDSVETSSCRFESTPAAGEEDRLHQVSLKRMFQLAAVKSGRDDLSSKLGESISLTQLECLPLEIQLQIANGDNIKLGSSGSKGTHRRTLGDQPSRALEIEAPTRNDPIHHGKPRHQPCTLDVQPDRTILVDECTTEPFGKLRTAGRGQGNLKAEEEDDEVVITGVSGASRSFYRDNIVPLRTWMDENDPDSQNAFEMVEQFLTVCVNERRLKEATVLLRSIRNRTDRWAHADNFRRMCCAVNEQASRVYGGPLDMSALGFSQR